MFLTMFFKMQNIVQTMHLMMLIAHPYMGGGLNPNSNISCLRCPYHDTTLRMIKTFHYTLTCHWYILRWPHRRPHDVTIGASTVQAKRTT